MKYQKTLLNKIQCKICPRECILAPNQSGFCLSRKNINNNIVSITYGYNTGLAIDPVEKKPLYHFYPTSKVLSFGTFGCNMGCLFCQNWHISKNIIKNCNLSTPEQIVQIAKEYDCKSIAFTYNEPITFFEYAIDTAKLCKKEGIKTIAVTAGYINREPAEEFFDVMDAANIDLKGFSEKFYSKNCMAHLNPVLDTIKYVVNETNCHVEITTMLIEGENDNDIENQCKWILDNLGDCIPIHFSAFYPNYKFLHKVPTSFDTLKKAYNIATSMGLKYVYTGNIPDINTSTTYCKNCGKAIIKRHGFNVIENNIQDNCCIFCHSLCDGEFN
jgi:pyruvate formate lyase activating enzyme